MSKTKSECVGKPWDFSFFIANIPRFSNTVAHPRHFSPEGRGEQTRAQYPSGLNICRIVSSDTGA